MTTENAMDADRQLADIVSRLILVVEEENRILAQNVSQSLDSTIHKKSQLLLELMRFQKSAPVVHQPPGNLQVLGKLKSALAGNQRLLSVHLAAARDITETLLEALRQGESDGTYGGGTSAYYGTP